MTATEVLRRLLDERGVEWEDMSIRPYACTSWRDPDGEPCTALEGADDIPDGKLSAQALLTPEQAIAATLGSCNCPNNCTNGERTETCHVESSIIDTYEYNRWEYELSCGHTIIWEDSEPPNYCPICGRRIEQ